MRTLRNNKSRLWYALQAPERKIYQTDDNGDIVYMEIQGEQVPVVKEVVRNEYFDITEFFANISMSGGDSEAVEYGIDKSAYSAKIIFPNNVLPITETSLIWQDNEPQMDDNGMVDKKTADYKVVRIVPSLNFTVYLLQKVVK